MGKASGGPRARRDAPLLATGGVRGSALGRKYDLLGYQLHPFRFLLLCAPWEADRSQPSVMAPVHPEGAPATKRSLPQSYSAEKALELFQYSCGLAYPT